MDKLKKGSRVKSLIDDGGLKKGMIGTVLGHSLSQTSVEWDDYINGHDGSCRGSRSGKPGHCWFVYSNDIVPYRDKFLEHVKRLKHV